MAVDHRRQPDGKLPCGEGVRGGDGGYWIGGYCPRVEPDRPRRPSPRGSLCCKQVWHKRTDPRSRPRTRAAPNSGERRRTRTDCDAEELDEELPDDATTDTPRDGHGEDAAPDVDADGDGRLNEEEWAKFAPLLNLTADDHKHFVGLRGRGDIDSLPYLIKKGDANGDGAIGEPELLELRRRLNGNNPNVIQSFREAAGADNKLDYNELIATVESFDKNGDGFDQGEWDRFAPILGMRPEDRKLFLDAHGKFDLSKFKTVFEVADINGDGQLDPEEVVEMRRLVLEYFAAEDAADEEPPAEDDQMTIQPYPFPVAPKPLMQGHQGHALGSWLPDHIAGLDKGRTEFWGNDKPS
jgi:Ca2+-binding EF-hand superfamily protein